MDRARQQLSLQQIREIDLVDYLSSLGHEPIQVRGADHWYHSPLREEKTPSFKINRKINKWFDFGIGQGGNLIDFGIAYFQCSVSGFAENINKGKAVAHQPSPNGLASEPVQQASKLRILSIKSLYSRALFEYLAKRGITSQLAEEHCKQVYFDLSGREYFAIGFKNNSGGYELRNPFLKMASSPKDFTTIDNGSDRVCVFEGFFDFLSYKAMHAQSQLPDQNYVVLNSIALFNRALPELQGYRSVQLFLDRDRPGQQLTKQAVDSDPRYEDASGFYKKLQGSQRLAGLPAKTAAKDARHAKKVQPIRWALSRLSVSATNTVGTIW